MILQDEQGKKWNFQPTGEDTQNKNNMMGFLSPAKEQKYVEGCLVKDADCIAYVKYKEKYEDWKYFNEHNEGIVNIKNIPNETLIKTIVQCWFPECTYATSKNTRVRDYDFRDDSGQILAFISFCDEDLKIDLPEIEIKRI